MKATLGDLLRGIEGLVGGGEPSIDVTSVTSDSRQVLPGTLFVAVKGQTSDGHAFIRQAQQSGAVAIVGEIENPGVAVPYLRVSDSRKALARISANFFGNPSHGMKMIGVTGTCGKTTTTYIIESILAAAGFRPGVIGTVSFRFGDRIFPATHTTPGPVELQSLLAQMKAAGCDAVVMEVSSHALKQHRADYIAFDAMVFTNLSPEHLDFHPDMEDYFLSKALLFTEATKWSRDAGKNPFLAINSDDDYGRKLLNRIGSPVSASSYGLGAQADVSGHALQIDMNGIRGEVTGIPIQSALTGRFNASNLLAAIAAARGLAVDSRCISEGIATLACVPGRLERVRNDRGINVLVDYAHKPDALENVLRTLAEVKGAHRLITVFGCGGDRDRSKRPVMGRLAVELSDHVVITSDNPRTEDPRAIIEEILKGIGSFTNYSVEPDRRRAIESALAGARRGDIVLIAGKGHEDYQIVADPAAPGKTIKIHFDDREVADSVLRVNLSP